jgi:nucleolar protein 53
MRRAPKQLRSLAILDERSAVPSLTVKSTTAPKTPKPISKSEKTRLRRIARKEMIDPDADAPTSNLAVGSITPQADAWEKEKVTVKKGTFGEETMVVRKVKAPKTVAEQRAMRRARLGLQMEIPDDGTSYNPRAESHAALMERAIAEEMELLRREKDTEERMKELAEVVNSRKAVGRTGEFADGMLVDPLDDNDQESGSELDPADIPLPKKQTVRKTQAQRNKQLKKRAAAEAEERERKQRAIHKQLGASAVYEIEKAGKERLEEMIKKDQATKAARKEKERLGLEGGEKIGKWNVPKGRVEVQLGEDLAESLRQLKVSQNEPPSGARARARARARVARGECVALVQRARERGLIERVTPSSLFLELLPKLITLCSALLYHIR